MSRVVVGTDGSAPSEAALEWAAAYAARRDRELELVHVLDDEWGASGGEYARMRAHEAAVRLSDTADRLAPAGRVTTRLVHGSPIQELANAAEPGDLLVVGSHKTGYVRGRALGSLGVRLATLARSSVLVMPQAPFTTAARGVILGVGPRPSPAALEVAADEAEAAAEPLMLLSAAPEQDRVRATEALALAASTIAARRPGLTVTRKISGRRPADALLDASRGARLLVLGAPGDSGGVTHDVLLNAVSPVYIAR